jgi:hypothetical protein
VSAAPERVRLRDAVRHWPLIRLCFVAALLVVPQVAVTGFGIELLIAQAGVSPVLAAQTLVTVHLAAAGLRLLLGWWADQGRRAGHLLERVGVRRRGGDGAAGALGLVPRRGEHGDLRRDGSRGHRDRIGSLASPAGWQATMGALVLPALTAATILANFPAWRLPGGTSLAS